jgi:hypothetical protein
MTTKKRTLFLLAMGALVLSYSEAAYADSFLNRMFPSIFGAPEPKKPGPEETLQAPFSTDGSAAGVTAGSSSSLMQMYDSNGKKGGNTLDLTTAHRSEEQLAEWVVGIVTSALTITPQSWAQDSQKFASGFSPYGLQEYKAHLDKTVMLKTLETNRLRLQAITDGAPVLLKEAAIDGTYHWLFKVPLILTYYDQGTRSIEKGQNVRSQTQRVTVQVQIGRIAAKPDEIGVAVERWIVQPN